MRLLQYFRPLPLRCAIVVVVAFLGSFLAGYRLAPELETGLFVNFRDKPFAPVRISLSQQHQKFVRISTHNTLRLAQIICFGTAIFLVPVLMCGLFGFCGGMAFWNLGAASLWARYFLPHSLVELPVALYVCAISMSSGLKWLAGGPEGRWRIFRMELAANVKLFLALIPFIIFAALLEAYVTNRW